MSYTSKDFLSQLNGVVSVTPKPYVDALLALHDLLDGKGINWVVSGALAERLRVVDIEANDIEIVSSKADAEKIFQAVTEFNPQPMSLQTQRLPRNAVIGGKEYPLYARSHGFIFNLNNVNVHVQGDLQFRIGEWDFGDVFTFEPEYVYIVGKKTAVTPLSLAQELYSYLGWTDRVEKIKRITERPHRLRNIHP